MSRFVTVDRNTAYLLPPSLNDWLKEDHLARFMVGKSLTNSTSPTSPRKYAGRGAVARHPSTLLALLVYGYASGIIASRKIERATYDSVAFRFIATGTGVTQAPNDKQQIAPILCTLAAQPQTHEQVEHMIADTGFFSEKNTPACEAAQITALIAVARDEHHPDWRARHSEPALLPVQVIFAQFPRVVVRA